MVIIDKYLLFLICLLILNFFFLGVVVIDKYLILEGDLFQYSFCFYFFMEIFIYSVYCVMFWWRYIVCNFVGFFVLVNQFLVGYFVYRWYQENFFNYLRERIFVIFFVYYSRLVGVLLLKKKKCQFLFRKFLYICQRIFIFMKIYFKVGNIFQFELFRKIMYTCKLFCIFFFV